MPRRISLLVAVLAVAGIALGFTASSARDYAWHETPTGSSARLRGLSAVSADVAWTSGSVGTVLRTVDAGSTWQQVSPPGTDALQFRDIEAFDADHAVILSIGPGDASRIYVTSDAGQHWTLTFVNDDPDAFYDCMTFFDRRRGLALSDPVGGRFRVIATNDGGLSWRGVGGAMPIHSGPSAGIFALAFRGQQHGLAVGGDFTTPEQAPDALALTEDGGVSWQLVDDAPNEYRSGATWVNGLIAIVVGPTGSDASFDHGRSWQRFDTGSFDTVDCAHSGACWASGAQDRAAYLIRQH